MKIYIMSDKPNLAIAAANAINQAGSAGTISEEAAEDAKSIISEAKSSLNSGFDLILVIWTSAHELSISANKFGGIKALACKDEDDAMIARDEAGANLILIDSMKVTKTRIAAIAAELAAPQSAAPQHKQPHASQATQQQPAPVPMPMGEARPSILDTVKEKVGSVSLKRPQQAGAQAPRRQQPDDDEKGPGFLSTIKKKGLSQSIKESLGIVDSEDDADDADAEEQKADEKPKAGKKSKGQ